MCGKYPRPPNRKPAWNGIKLCQTPPDLAPTSVFFPQFRPHSRAALSLTNGHGLHPGPSLQTPCVEDISHDASISGNPVHNPCLTSILRPFEMGPKEDKPLSRTWICRHPQASLPIASCGRCFKAGCPALENKRAISSISSACGLIHSGSALVSQTMLGSGFRLPELMLI